MIYLLLTILSMLLAIVSIILVIIVNIIIKDNKKQRNYKRDDSYDIYNPL